MRENAFFGSVPCKKRGEIHTPLAKLCTVVCMLQKVCDFGGADLPYSMGAYWVQQLSRQHPGAGGAHLGLFRVLLRRSGGMWLPGTRGAALYHKCARNGWPAWPFDASPCPHESARWPGGTAREIRVCPTSELGSTLVPDGDLGCSEHGMSMIWDLDTTPRPQTIATKSRILQYLGLVES